MKRPCPAWLLVLVYACRQPVVTSAVSATQAALDIDFRLTAPPCPILAAGEDWELPIVNSGAGLLVTIEVLRPDRSFFAAKQVVHDQQSTSVHVPANAFQLGQNEARVAVSRGLAHSDISRIALSVVAPVPGATKVDSDGDCYSPYLGDCDEADPNVHPAAAEVCGNGRDDDCNGKSDLHEPSCVEGCVDLDGDGAQATSCGGTDCDDANPLARPGVAEACDGVDNDCDGLIDEAFDSDGDSFVRCPAGSGYAPLRRTNGASCPSGYASCADCDDHDASIYPGPHEPTTDHCGNGIFEPLLGEECEDSNHTNGDGCSTTCVVECPTGTGNLCLNGDQVFSATNCAAAGGVQAQTASGSNASRTGYKLATNNHCFVLYSDVLLFPNAVSRCLSAHGPNAYPAVLETEEERHLVWAPSGVASATGPTGCPALPPAPTGPTGALVAAIQAMPGINNGIFLGATDTLQEDHYQWLDGSDFPDPRQCPYAAATFPFAFRWFPGRPDNFLGNQDCLLLKTNLRLDDLTCHLNLNPVSTLCEVPDVRPSCPPP